MVILEDSNIHNGDEDRYDEMWEDVKAVEGRNPEGL